ncbi:hypothetical protein AOQ84DRAFT_379373 [Glonium stellatum]|uniref:Kinesin light chain n=1 Tax=Glonium stellatum TaxID=574774 RepID=A0A8E2EWJ8_9PEZI|nr:hypothetical protein AOQ84DRAFT_379373 [Glonium stellatum]
MYQRALQEYKKARGLDYILTLNTVNNLGNLYKSLGRLNEAEKMYQRALQEKEMAWGLDYILTLDTVNNLGNLYVDLGRLDEAEKMHQRALQGYEKALGPENIQTFLPALRAMWGLAFLSSRQDRVEDARSLYLTALSGYQKVVGDHHPSCQALRDNLAALGREGNKTSAATYRESMQTRSQPQTIVDPGAGHKLQTSRRHKILERLSLKRT